MSEACLCCLGEGAPIDGFHPRCSRFLFGTDRPPLIDVDTAKLHTLALAMVGKTSLSSP